MEPNWQLARKKTVLEQRARIVQQVRAFFVEHHFLEVETPHRIPANAPELFIDAIASEAWFLQTSPELCMKRLLAAGHERIFQICHCWRAAERGQNHLPEYTMLEWYHRNSDYRQLMTDCESLFTKLVPELSLQWQGATIDLTPPWPKMTVHEAFHIYCSISIEDALATDRFDDVISTQIEPLLPKDRPLFLVDYPLEKASLAKKKEGTQVAERVELFMGGLELANGFSELTDSDEQRRRFEEEESLRRQMGKPAYDVPLPFLEDLKNLPPSSGIALGIDRMIMLLCNCTTIDDVVFFPPETL